MIGFCREPYPLETQSASKSGPAENTMHFVNKYLMNYNDKYSNAEAVQLEVP